MSRVGFKKIIAASAFNNAAVDALAVNIKTYIVNAGFGIVLNSVNEIDFKLAGVGAAEHGDDIPRWYFYTNTTFNPRAIEPYAYQGVDANDVGAIYGGNSQKLEANTGLTQLTIHFAADGSEGWWWLHVAKADGAQASGFSTHFAAMGARSRRYPADNHQGLCSRYGVLELSGTYVGVWWPPYVMGDTGSEKEGPNSFFTWSPLTGEGWGSSRTRHTGSPLQKLAAPAYPCSASVNGDSEHLLGEYSEVLFLTDGYAHEEVVAAGWVAMVGANNATRYAAPSPTSFTLL